MKPHTFYPIIFIAIIVLSAHIPAMAELSPDRLPGTSRQQTDSIGSHPSVTLKTNAILWATTVMNVECEVRFHPHISASLGLAWCPWFFTERFALRNLSIMPEIRWWLKPVQTGHFFGLHLATAWYNVKYGDFRYQDSNRPLLNAGVTYGYRFRLTPRLGIELSIGAGFASLQYDRFHNVNNGALADTRRTTWFGIDRAAISLTYSFTRK